MITVTEPLRSAIDEFAENHPLPEDPTTLQGKCKDIIHLSSLKEKDT